MKQLNLRVTHEDQPTYNSPHDEIRIRRNVVGDITQTAHGFARGRWSVTKTPSSHNYQHKVRNGALRISKLVIRFEFLRDFGANMVQKKIILTKSAHKTKKERKFWLKHF